MKHHFLAMAFCFIAGGRLFASSDSVATPLESEKARFDQPPTAIGVIRPQYPFEMRRKGLEGDVIVEFTVAVDGRAREAKVIEATRKDFHLSALAAVEKARFKPAMKDGRAVTVRVRVPLYYRLGPPTSK